MPPAAASLAALATGFLLRSSGAFILPPTGADGSSTPIHRETDHVSTVAPRAGAHDGRYRRPEFIGWGRVVGKTELPGGILCSTSNSVVDGETTPNKDENKITASMTSVLVGRSSLGGGETAMDVEVSGEEGGGGGEGGLWKGRWKNGLRKTVGVIAPILKRGSPQTAEGGQDQVDANSYSCECLNLDIDYIAQQELKAKPTMASWFWNSNRYSVFFFRRNVCGRIILITAVKQANNQQPAILKIPEHC